MKRLAGIDNGHYLFRLSSPFFNRKTLLTVILAGILLGGIHGYRLWQPARQVALHQRHFLDALENRDWDRLGRFLADDFTDRYGHDKAWILQEAGEVRRHFFVLTIEERESDLRLDPEETSAEVTSLVRISGNGTALATEVQLIVNRESAPFHFRWKRQSRKPWDWQLVSVDHPLLAREMP